MNNVHLVTQEKKSSRKTRLKTKPGARAPNWPSPCAQAACPAPRPCAPRLLPGKIVARPVHPRACRPCALPLARASACAPAAPVPAACAPSAPPARPAPRLRLLARLARAQRPCPALAPLVTIQFCIAIQFGLLQPFQPQYSELYYDTLLPLNQLYQPAIQYLYCNTMFFPTKYLAIQFFLQPIPSLQYNIVYCNKKKFSQYNWAVAQKKRFCPIFFFFSLSLLLLFFSYFSSKKSLKSFLFSFFLGHSNKFIKMYFSPFSSILHHIKP